MGTHVASLVGCWARSHANSLAGIGDLTPAHLVPRAELKGRDFYRQLCTVFNLPPSDSGAGMFLSIYAHIDVLRLDEAHLLPQDVFEHLHTLANDDWDRQPLLSIVLIVPSFSSDASRSTATGMPLWTSFSTARGLRIAERNGGTATPPISCTYASSSSHSGRLT